MSLPNGNYFAIGRCLKQGTSTLDGVHMTWTVCVRHDWMLEFILLSDLDCTDPHCSINLLYVK